ncbi:MAG: tetraacyldisaccharide 4'-kinase [Chitinophagaceae bacterium]|nr:tetraacyldisaccharide 4'-kinase [Chitinophagaceae bacterium]
MNFNAPLLRPIRILLFPFSLVYAAVVWLRNWLFDRKILSSTTFNLPIICVGNLSAGGTGKSPLIEILISFLKDKYKVAALSRGYKRKTQGYALANATTTALEIGDEPFLFYKKFPEVTVAVGEERLVAIPQLLHDKPDTQVILLDDAFQHRSVLAGLNIVLTDYNNLYTRDWWLPTGDLRDERRSAIRADILIVTKCKNDLTEEEAQDIIAELSPAKHQEVFFTTIRYGLPYHIVNHNNITIHDSLEVLLVSGIADPRPLKKYLLEHSQTYYEILYSDHHIFSIDDWKDILKRFNNIQHTDKIILTTEKDAVRLMKFNNELKQMPVYVIPISIQFLFQTESRFHDLISKFITNFNHK